MSDNPFNPIKPINPMMKKLFLLAVFSLFAFHLSPCQAQPVVSDSSQTGWVADVVNWYDAHMSYWTAGGLMAVESSFVPFPSEVVIPPAVYLSLDENSNTDMTWWLVVLVGTLGALIGAYINYFLALWLGRPIIYKFANSKVGHLLRLSQENVERAEEYFNKHGAMSTLVGRFIPVIRQLISLPAGMARMNLLSFTIYTGLGALIWNCVLALLGYLAHLAGDMAVIAQYSHEISVVILALLAVVILFFVIRYFLKKHKKSKQEHLS